MFKQNSHFEIILGSKQWELQIIPDFTRVEAVADTQNSESGY